MRAWGRSLDQDNAVATGWKSSPYHTTMLTGSDTDVRCAGVGPGLTDAVVRHAASRSGLYSDQAVARSAAMSGL